MRIICFGDSITGDRPRRPYLHQYLKYSDVLQALLDAQMGAGVAIVLNRGWAGDRTYPDPAGGCPGALARLGEDVLAETPAIVTVLIGGNDEKEDDTGRTRTRTNLDTLFARLRGVRTLALLYHLLPDPARPQTAWRHLTAANPLISAAAIAAGVPVLDLGPPFAAALDAHPREELVDPMDGAHLRPRGEVVVALAVHARLRALGWLGPYTGTGR